MAKSGDPGGDPGGIDPGGAIGTADPWSGGGSVLRARRKAVDEIRRAIYDHRKRARVITGPVAETVASEKHVLQKDFLHVVSSPTSGYTEVEFTRNTDGGMRAYASDSGGGGSGGAWVLDEGTSSTSYGLGTVVLDGGSSAP